MGQNFITQALYVNALRGWDSTGLVAIRKGKAEYYKRALSAADFIRTRAFNRIATGQAEAFIGHNRAATVGGVTDETAHPFVHDHIIGVHNGTLDWGWRKELKDGDKFSVDSDALIYNIAHEGIKETVAKAEGAFAIVYYDMRERTLNIIRNKERPMYYGLLNYKDEDKWVFGSEAGLIEWIGERTDNGDSLKDVWELKEGNLLTFDLEKAGSKPSIETMTVAGRSTYNQAPFRGGQYNWNNTKSSATNTAGTNERPNVSLMPHEKKLFAKHKIDHTERLEFWPTQWIAYGGNSQQGVLRGAMVDSPYIEVAVYNVAKSETNMAAIYAAYPVTVRAKPYITRKHGVDTASLEATELEMVLSSPTLIEVDEFATTTIVEQEKDDKPFQKALPDYTGSKFLGPKGTILSQVEYDDLTREGCASCGDNLIYGVDRVLWTVDEQPLCEQCNVDLLEEMSDGAY